MQKGVCYIAAPNQSAIGQSLQKETEFVHNTRQVDNLFSFWPQAGHFELGLIA